jgi:hypothetical protein
MKEHREPYPPLFYVKVRVASKGLRRGTVLSLLLKVHSLQERGLADVG